MTKLFKASPVVEKYTVDLSERCRALAAKGIFPQMKVILVGDHPASKIYTTNKKKFCEKIGALCDIIHLPEDISENEFLKKIKAVFNDKKVHGCFVQLPLPEHLKHFPIGEMIPPEKDVDGFHPKNLNALLKGDKGANCLLPCTPKGIITLLHHYGVELSGKHVVVIGRSLIVGRPMNLLLINYDATVTLCHSKTQNLNEITKTADILIAAIGIPNFINKSHLGPNKKPIIIDVGINHDSSGKLCGDVDFDSVSNSTSGISPVPGGVGPMTIVSLVQNLLQAAEKEL